MDKLRTNEHGGEAYAKGKDGKGSAHGLGCLVLGLVLCVFVFAVIFGGVTCYESGILTHVDYVGNSFHLTTPYNVDVFFSKEDIIGLYTVMGHAQCTAGWWLKRKSSKSGTYMGIRERLIEEAQNKGADAILITGLHQKHNRIDASFLKYSHGLLRRGKN